MASLALLDEAPKTKSLRQREHPLSSPDSQLAMLDGLELGTTFEEKIETTALGTLHATSVDILQINVGRQCNQTCRHCHVDAGPDRTEVMPDDVVDGVIEALQRTSIPTLDITGGAPELHPRFEELVEKAYGLGRHVMDRCNLTILRTNKYKHLPKFFADHQVEVVCSLPYFTESSTDAQRGDGVFEDSMAALQALNAEGYGMPGSKLRLVLVSNPVGAFLPASQAEQESQFRRRLRKSYGIEFSELFTITNMPISRYLEWLDGSGNLDSYMKKLVGAFNPSAAEGVMCRNTISIGWDGRLFDCDFNQMLDLELVDGQPRTLRAWLDALDDHDVATRPIQTHLHCFGCTAGQGSSCGGATA